jgi:PAS domain S-box-containing protein
VRSRPGDVDLPVNAQKFIQSRWPWLAVSLILTVSLFVSTTLGWLWYADQRETAARQLSLDLLWLEQIVTESLNDNQNKLSNWVHDLQMPSPRATADFMTLADGLMKENSALIAIDYLDKDGHRLTGLPNYVDRPTKLPPITDPLITEAIQRSFSVKKPVYSKVIEQYAPLWVLVVPISEDSPNSGVILATYDLDQLLAKQVPWWFVQRYDLSLVDRDDKQLSPRDSVMPEVGSDIHRLDFGPNTSGLSLRASPHAGGRSEGLLLLLSVAVVAFGLLIIWLLRILQRWLRERQAAQLALSRELRFREAMEQSLVTGLLAFDPSGRIIYANPALCNMLGLTVDSLIGATAPFSFWPDDGVDECQAAHEAMLQGDNPSNGRRLNLLGAEGRALSVRLFASPLVDADGRPSGWMVSLYDTTELQKEREALAASREQLYAVLSGLEAAVSVSAHDDGRLLFRNRLHFDLFRFDAEDDCCLMAWPGMPRGTELKSVEFLDRINGRWYHVERRNIHWVDNSSVILDIATDVSAERQAADTARERDELLQHTARLASLAEFASGIAHELNQPLAAIANYSAAAASFLEAAPMQLTKVQEAVNRMGDESRRAGKIIHSMRSFIQKRASRHDTHNLFGLLAEPLALLAPFSKRLQVEIKVDVIERDIMIDCDAVMIEQVLFNLLRNALEAISDQALAGTAQAVAVQIVRDDESVIVSVADSGPGFSDPDKLFQPFYTTKSDSMGLGLAICRTVIESHGGRLWGEANVGGGACFKFRLPSAVLV